MDKKKIKRDRITLGALIAFRKANNRMLKREMKAIKEGNLTLSQFAVLEILYYKGDLRIADIIDGVLSSSGNITVVIKNLKRDGYITQVPDEKDKRASLISITEKGVELIEEILPSHFENIEEGFKELTREEEKTLIHLLNKIK